VPKPLLPLSPPRSWPACCLLWLSDGVLWGSLACLLIYGLSPERLKTWLIKPTTTIVLAMNDANALVRGSAVNLAGVNVGRVDALRIVDADHVDVTLKLNPDAPPLPSQAQATVVFSGLGGVKTVEIELPTEQERLRQLTQATPGGQAGPLQIQSPVRLQEAIDYQLDTALTLKQGADGLRPLVEYDQQPLLKAQLAQTNQASHQAKQSLVSLNQHLVQQRNNLHAMEHDAEGRLRPLNQWLAKHPGNTVSPQLAQYIEASQQPLRSEQQQAAFTHLTATWATSLTQGRRALPSPLAWWQAQLYSKLALRSLNRGLTRQQQQWPQWPASALPPEQVVPQVRQRLNQINVSTDALNQQF
jgi:hypothetical protein